MNVLLPQPVEAEAVSLLEGDGCEVVVAPDPNVETVAPLMVEAHGLILRTGISITRELLKEAENLMVISRTGGGLDNVDIPAASEKGIIVTSNPGVNTHSVVEHLLALILALSKKLPLMDSAVRSADFSIRYRGLPRDLFEKTLGLVGFGRIGSTLGRVCNRIFGMNVLAFDPFLPDEAKKEYEKWATFVELEELLAGSDVISLHTPLTDKTRGMIGAAEIARMKSDALLINTSRGPVVDERALIDALKDRKIGGAGLDVLEKEPPAPDNPLLRMENVILTPHTAALTRECVIRMAVEAARCVLDVFNGKEPRNVTNPEVLKLGRWKKLQQSQ